MLRGVEKIIFLVWGGRRRTDLYFDLSAIGIEHVFIPTFSREKVDGKCHGYVQNAALNLGLDLQETTVYACGSEAMIKDAMVLLVENGLQANRFYSDAFVSSR